MLALRSTLFTALMIAWTLVYAAFFVLIGGFLSVPARFAVIRFYARRMLDMLRILCGLTHVVEGLENIPSEPHVALWKHSSAWETFAQFLIGPPKVLVLKRELMFIPFVGFGLSLLRSIPIDRGARGTAVNQVVERGSARLAEGLSVLVFPEGTRVGVTETRRYGVSGALLAARTGCKIVPIAHDAGYYWPRRGLLKKPGVIRVRIGAPIDATGRDPRELNEQVQAWIEAAIAEMRR
jgi:1-acyl-sn-glycerol-3-phosphate acyltransferase